MISPLTDSRKIHERREKFKRRAKLLVDQDQLTQILWGFPPDQRLMIYGEVQSSLTFQSHFPAEEEFRIAGLSVHEYEKEASEKNL